MVLALLIICCPIPFSVFTRMFIRLGRPATSAKSVALCLGAIVALGGGWTTASAGTKSPTTTTLAVTSGGSAATSVASGSVVTLTASVLSGATNITTGQVNFCDASAAYCTDIHLLGMAQLTSAGTAMLKFRPGIGSRSYKAVFAGTNTFAGSASSVFPLTVTGTPGQFPSTTTIAESGSWGNYQLTATVTESGGTAPPTGPVSFLDTSNVNSVLNTVALEPAVAGINWPNPQGLTMSVDSRAVALGDFNGDGIPDLAVVAGGPSSPLVILLGNADGTYTAAAAPAISGYSIGPIAVADFNGDGNQDLAVLNGDTNTVAILLGNGDGTFNVAASSSAIGSDPKQVAVGDFNSDGIPDLAVTSLSSAALNILLGNGDGTFTAAPSPTAGNSPLGIAVGDFNGNGTMDLAVTDLYDDTVSILLGNGDGTFAAATSLHCGSQGSPIAAADFSGNGKLDLAVGISAAAGSSDSVTVLAGNGDGTFTSPAAGQAVTTGYNTSVQVGDFNGDGIPDVVLADSTTGTFSVFPGNGSGSFTSAFSAGVPEFPYHQLVSVVGDIDGDGRSDLVVGDDDSTTVSIFLTKPTETATATADLSLVGIGQHLVDASYGGDGNYNPSVSGTIPLWGVQPATSTTLTLTSSGAPVTSVTPGTSVALTATVQAGANPVTTGQVNFCDASASYCTDIHLLGTVALTSSGTATFKFVPGSGVHSYKAVFVEDGYGLGSSSAASTLTVGPAPSVVYTDTTAISSSGQPGAYSLTATVVGSGGSAPPTGSISFLDTSFGNTALATAPLGPSTAGLGWLVSQTPAASDGLISEVTGDFNGDGIPDLAVLWASYSGTAGVTIFFGNGDGTFTAGPTTQGQIGAQYSPGYMIAGDFNGDGKTDLALLSYPLGYLTDNVTTLLGNGDGTFTVSAASTVFNQGPVGGDVVSGSMIAADFNGDGKLDLAVVGDYVSVGGVTILLGNGDGTFTAAGPNLQADQDFGLIASGDFNGDGIPDLVAAQYFGPGGATVFLGKGDGTFTAVATLPVGEFPNSVVVGDFSGDGKLDLAFSDPFGVAIFLGNGDGTFNQTSGSPIVVPSEIYSLTAGDFNQDGKLDLAGVDNYNDVIDLLLGAGDGTFTLAPTAAPVSQDRLGPFALVAADFNEDGVPDLAMLTTSVDTASILLTEPTQTATAVVTGIAPVGAGTHNVDASYSGDATYSPSVSATIALPAGLAPVVISPASGTYSSVQSVTLSESVPGATIYYSAYGTVNTAGFIPYTGSIALTEGGTETIQAYATETGYDQSDFTTATYNLNLQDASTPVFSLAAGSYAGPQTVTISDSVSGAAIYYTTNGSVPTSSSLQYTGPITVSSSETLVANANASGYSTSLPAAAQYLIDSSSTSLIYTVAGNGTDSYTGDGGPATVGGLNYPGATVIDSAGNLYIADGGNNVVRKVAAGTGIITTVAGTGLPGYSGDNGPATSAQLDYPVGLALDGAGNLYISDSVNNVVREVNATTGIITTYVGAGLIIPDGMASDAAGNLYIGSYEGSVFKVTPTGTITIVAGTGQYGYSGDGGPATSAEIGAPRGIAIDGAGNLYIADSSFDVVREVSASTGFISTVAGTPPPNNVYPEGQEGYSGDGGPATAAKLYAPEAVTVDNAGNLYIADTGNSAIRKVTASNGIITTVAGNGNSPECNPLGGDGGPAASAGLCNPDDVSVDSMGNLYIADTFSNRIRLVTAPGVPPATPAAVPTFSLQAGTYPGPQTVSITDTTPGAAIYVAFGGASPSTLSPGYNGPINVTGTVTIQAISVAPGYLPSAPVSATYTIMSPPVAVISTVAGSGVQGFSGAGGPPTSAAFYFPDSVALDGAGNLYIADSVNNVVWEVSAKTGLISIVAGNGTQGYSGDGGPAANAQLFYPQGLASDSAGNLYIADMENSVIRRVAADTGIITTAAGDGNPQQLNNGDGGPATSATLSYPNAVVLDSAGNLYIADDLHAEVRKVTASTGIITTVAGTGNFVYSGDGGPATSAGLEEPNALALDSAGNLYIAAYGSGRIRKVAADTGIITAVAGNGVEDGNSGDGGAATSAVIDVNGMAVDAAGDIFFSNGPGSIREVSASTGIISRVAGNNYPGYSGDGGSATIAQIDYPQGMAFDAAGNLYFADENNERIRKVSFPGPAAAPVFSLAAGTYTGAQTVTITDGIAGATIYYTTDGTAPTTGSTVYTGAITISTTTTLQAIAVATGYTQSAAASAVYTIQLPIAPTLTVTPSSISITTAQTLTVMVAVNSGSGGPTPTGSVNLTSGSYAVQQNLAKGTATFSLAAGALPVGADTLTATYAPDAASAVDYTSATQSATVTVTQAIGAAMATVTLTPSATTVTNDQSVNVTVSVAGGSGPATGTIVVAGGSYSAQQPLAGATTTFSVPAGAFSAGPNTLTANYSGDATYAVATGTTTITVTPVVIAVSNPASVAPGNSASATATFSAGNTYSGTMNLTCALTASPAGAQSLPSCSLNPASITISSGGSAATILTVKTTAASSNSALLQPAGQNWKRPNWKTPNLAIQDWKKWGGGGVLALALIVGVPSWRRRRLIMMVVLFGIAVAGVFGCGGGGGGGGGSNPPPSTPATTAGSYTFLVTGTDASNAKITTSTNLTVTVQ